MRRQGLLQACGLAAALLLVGGGGGDDAAPGGARVESLAQARPATGADPMSASLPQPPQAAPAWVPTAAGLMQWAEQAYPQHFPSGASDRTWSVFTYRRYPQTGNILAVAGEGIYIAGPVSGGPATLVGRLSDFACNVNPSGCMGVTETVVPPAATTPVVQASTVLSGVTAVLLSPSRIDAAIFPGQPTNSVTLLGTVRGDATQLAGKTLYIIVEDPHSLFRSSPQVTLSGTTVRVVLGGNTLTTLGVREGNLKIYACLDPSCATQLGGSPILLPYKVSVVGDAAVDTSSVSVQSTYGSVPASRTVGVTLPAYTAMWGIRHLCCSFKIAPTASTQLGNTVGTVTLAFLPAAPGNYSDQIEVYGSTTADATMRSAAS